jgi:hypothetical protein
MTASIVSLCWICGGAATTGEHKTKRSDLKAVFQEPTQRSPLFLRNDGQKSLRIGTLDNRQFKFPNRLCAHCNNARTQPHDRAWERLSEALRQRVETMRGPCSFRANRVFPYDTRRQLLNVHLYFVKIFGCMILEGNVPIDTLPFSAALLAGRAHPNVYLKFGRMRLLTGQPYAGRSNLETAARQGETDCAFATWFYSVGDLAVNVMYALPGERRNGLRDAWHPRMTSRLLLADFA